VLEVRALLKRMTVVDENAPGEAVQIVPASWRDLGALRTLERVCFPQDAWPFFDLVGVLTLPHLVRLKALAAGEMVGFIAGEFKPGEPAAWIATVGVLPEYRRQGIGRALLARCEAELPAGYIRLCVRFSNEAARLMYEREGYVAYNTWRRYYRDGEDALVMQKVKPPPRRI
jgi:[ribosomal protein S18]-alanine N-acetyltransferase